MMRTKVRGFNKNEQTLYIKLKLEVLAKLDIIDKNVEIHGLSAYDRKEQKELREQLGRLLKQEEMKWLQRCKEKETKEGDSNTRYYHAKANGRRSRNKIYSLI